MKYAAIAFVLLFAATSNAADLPPGASLVRRVEWKAVKLPPAASNNEGHVSVTRSESSPGTIPLLDLPAPGLHTKWYALRGQVRYRDVEGTSYFNLWNEFAGANGAKASYFSRTLADYGPLAKISGASDWRPLAIPFDGSQAKAPPVRLELDLVLAGKGVVDLSDLELLEFADAGAMWSAIMAGQPGLHAPWISLAAYLGVASLMLGAGILLARLWRRRKTEIRRMRAMDAA